MTVRISNLILLTDVFLTFDDQFNHNNKQKLLDKLSLCLITEEC